MATLPPAPMDGRFFWSDETETYVANMFTDFAQVPRNKGFITGLFHYLDPATNTPIGPPYLGFILTGWDKYYVNATGAGPQNIEYAMWNLPANNNTQVTVWSLTGYATETSRTAKVGSFPANRIFDGATVTQDVLDRINTRVKLFM